MRIKTSKNETVIKLKGVTLDRATTSFGSLNKYKKRIDNGNENRKTAKRFTFKWEEETKDVITKYIERTIKSTAHEKRDIDNNNKYNTLPYGYNKL